MATRPAALRVLTQPLLFALVTSFQSGISGLARSLLQRYEADGPRPKKVPRAVRLGMRRDPRERERHLADAIAKYDSADLHALEVVLRTSVFAGDKPQRARLHLVHLLCEAAAAFGRLDMLRWFHDHGDLGRSSARLVQFCAKEAARRGDVSILSWIEETFGRSSLEVLRSYQVLDLCQGPVDIEVLRWFTDRDLGVIPYEVTVDAIRREDIASLRLCLRDFDPVGRSDVNYVKVAVNCGSLAVVQYLVAERKAVFFMSTVEYVLELGLDTIAHYLLQHRFQLSCPAAKTLDPEIVQMAIVCNNLRRLELLVSIPQSEEAGISLEVFSFFGDDCPPTMEAVRLLLPVSSSASTTRALLRLSIAQQPVVNWLLEHCDVNLPDNVRGFCQRALTNSLGVLATAVRDHEPIEELLASATRKDLHDAALCSLWTKWQVMDALLTHGKELFDAAFLRFCLALSRNVARRQILAQRILEIGIGGHDDREELTLVAEQHDEHGVGYSMVKRWHIGSDGRRGPEFRFVPFEACIP